MDLSTQKEIAAEVLHKIKQGVDTDAVIAGGAPRNWDEAKLANDIDIYLRSNSVDTAGMIKGMLSKVLGFDVKADTLYSSAHYDLGKTFSIQKIFGFTHKGVKFQLMFIKPKKIWEKGQLAKEVMGNFDLGINMLYVDWDFISGGLTTKTDEYHRDRNNKTLTMYVDNMTDSQLRQCLRVHLPKMQSYYPEYSLVIN